MPTLNWLTRDEDLKAAGRAPYRLLEEVADLGYGDRDAGNMLIQGDNLDALKALLPFYAGKVKCIYIDPPYNTRSAVSVHYDDNVEHSQWLAIIWPRLELLRELLSEDGSIWVSIDDNEGHYLKVIMDEVFGRSNFVANIIWEKRKSRENRRVFSFKHDHVLVFAKERSKFEATRNPSPVTDEVLARYKNPDGDPRGVWQSVAITAQSGHATPSQFYQITTPGGRKLDPPAGNCWRFTERRLQQLIEDGRIYFGPEGNNVPRQKKFLSESEDAGLTPETIWYADAVGTNDTAKRHANALIGDGAFDNPKPEELLQQTLHIASNPGDLVLDSFLGSGTTAAVAQKMGRRFIGVEVGAHAETHCVPRLKKVIDGEQGGSSKALNWAGGGGFRFYRLGPPVFDESGHIRSDITFPVLAAHVWFSETNTPWNSASSGPALGIQNDHALALLYNGVLGDKRPAGGNVLTRPILKLIRDSLPAGFAGALTVYGERTILSDATLARERITFKQTPYDVKARR